MRALRPPPNKRVVQSGSLSAHNANASARVALLHHMIRFQYMVATATAERVGSDSAIPLVLYRSLGTVAVSLRRLESSASITLSTLYECSQEHIFVARGRRSLAVPYHDV